jgi:hypothetical protein
MSNVARHYLFDLSTGTLTRVRQPGLGYEWLTHLSDQHSRILGTGPRPFWDNLFFGLTPHKTPDTDGDVAIRNSFGLENKFNEGNEMPRIFNFGLPEDSALNSWVLNNLHFKPDDVGHSYYYQHVPIAPNLTYKLFQHAPGQNPRQVTRQTEAMGYVTKSLTRTAGLDLRTRGSIQDSHSMSSWGPGANHSGFGEVHSAQWRWPYQSTHLFWNRLFIELQLMNP